MIRWNVGSGSPKEMPNRKINIRLRCSYTHTRTYVKGLVLHIRERCPRKAAAKSVQTHASRRFRANSMTKFGLCVLGQRIRMSYMYYHAGGSFLGILLLIPLTQRGTMVGRQPEFFEALRKNPATGGHARELFDTLKRASAYYFNTVLISAEFSRGLQKCHSKRVKYRTRQADR